jgi:hydroxyacylglutathione hydrolase
MSQVEIKRIPVGFLQANCYLLMSDNEILVIDPGGEPLKILKEIKKMKGRVKYIINTHSHPDHNSANKKIQKETGAEILKPKDGEIIRLGKITLEVIHTPGHSKDSICLLGDNFIFTGDTLFKDGYGRTDLLGGSLKELEESLKKLEKKIKPKIKVYPGHDEPFEIKNV